MVRRLKTKNFSKDAGKLGVSDAELHQIAAKAEDGLHYADLGGGVLKMRDGGHRTIIFTKQVVHTIFATIFEKSSKDNLSAKELSALKKAASVLRNAGPDGLDLAVKKGVLIQLEKEQGPTE